MTTRGAGATRTAHVPSASLSFREALVALVRPLAVDEAERRLERELGSSVVLFASARGALATAFEVVGTDEAVAVPAFTCAAVANAVLSAGKTPVYVDVNHHGTVDPTDWPSDALPLVQDTFGYVAPTPEGRAFVRDAAHRTYPVNVEGATVAVTSFEHSKSLSAGRGGLAHTADVGIAAQLRGVRDRRARTDRHVRSSLVTMATIAMGRLDYRGRHRVAELFRKAAWQLDADRLLGQSDDELRGKGVDNALLGAPGGASARLVVSQLRRAAGVAQHRQQIVGTYDRLAGLSRDPLPLVRYPLLAASPDAFEQALQDAGWDVRGRWFTAPLHPQRTDHAALGYVAGTAPRAEALVQQVVNLPTHPLVTAADAMSMMQAALAAGASPL